MTIIRRETFSMRLAPLIAALLLAACAHHPAKPGLRVTGLTESRTAVASAQESSREASVQLARIKTLSGRGDAKATLILKWLNRQEQREHARP